ncbi:hypothetical protein PLICRDRAFT_148897 [Plicaturopsis crispa FD-325 SS-3]|nr:hypothetical protein PLICRDRAFT_148897 [Plicaturopsis crispa FD-325 SS-3]
MSPKDEVSKPALRAVDLIHGDDHLSGPSVAPHISVTSTFKAPHPSVGVSNTDFDPRNPTSHIYSRYTQDNSTRAEHILSKINQGYALTYASGLAASYAAIVYYQPKRIAITAGYHGFHNGIEVYRRKHGGADIKVIDLDDEFQEGDVAWVETPLNPTGESRDIKYYADKVHAVGGKLIVDSTFGPPPLQYPFKWGADCVMHSGTKYFGGHSDLLAGVLVVKTPEEWNGLWSDRTYTGNMMGALESWLLLRSLRTLHLRVPRQSATATALALWLSAAASTPAGQSYDGIPGGVIEKVWHSSLQKKDARGFEPSAQMEGGFNPTFAILIVKAEYAAVLPYTVKYFVPATSLGGVESLMEQRVRSDPGADPRVVRLSIGVEDLEDLKDDLRSAFQEIVQAKSKL